MSRITRYFMQDRLVYYRHYDSIDWDEHWANLISDKLFPAKVNGLGPLSFLKQALPRHGKILEAGCGRGQIVHKLRMMGFDCEGVDNAMQTIRKVKELRPDLPVTIGDVLHLDVPDNYYSGYVSLGVIEHRQEGPEPFLDEAWRVVKPGGIAVFTVPFNNSLRRLKAKLGCFSAPPKPEEVFYQYAFTRQELTGLLQAHKFAVTSCAYYDPWKGLKDEIPLFAAINRNPSLAIKFRSWAERSSWLYPYVSHMLALVCRKIL